MKGVPDLWGEARVLQSLGLALERFEGADAARGCWLKALAIFTQLGEPEAEEVRAYLLALQGESVTSWSDKLRQVDGLEFESRTLAIAEPEPQPSALDLGRGHREVGPGLDGAGRSVR
jgi:hypothetical protein